MKKNIISGPEIQSDFPPVPSVNFHLWKSCNMKCKFCFATFDDYPKGFLPKGHLPQNQAIEVVKALAVSGFSKITFAGGEPLLCPWLPALLREAKKGGMTTMIVSNGYRLSQEWVKENAEFIDWFTLSIDSLQLSTQLASGRAHRGKIGMDEEEYLQRVRWIKETGIRLKINTVVHGINWEEDLNSFIQMARPERWKLFQMLPVKGQNDEMGGQFKINEEQFHDFLLRHEKSQQSTVLIPESNDDMTSSYVMVDPAGRFFDNSLGEHSYSRPILSIGVQTAFEEIELNREKFLERGGEYDWAGSTPIISVP